MVLVWVWFLVGWLVSVGVLVGLVLLERRGHWYSDKEKENKQKLR